MTSAEATIQPRVLRKGTRKSKAQACDSCRRQKARCEVLAAENVDGTRRCHRCTVLKTKCSLENDSLRLISLPTQPPSQPESASSSHTSPPSIVRTDSTHVQRMALASNTNAYKRPFYLTTSNSPSARLTTPRGTPSRNPFMWHFVPQPVDWSAPISALQELSKTPELGSSSFVVHDEALDYILPQDQVDHLLSMYVSTLVLSQANQQVLQVFVTLHSVAQFRAYPRRASGSIP